MMAAAEAGRDMCYFTFNDSRLSQDVHNIQKIITGTGATVGKFFDGILPFLKQFFANINCINGLKSNYFCFILPLI